MKKTTDEELNKWRYQFPSSTVSRITIGDSFYSKNFIGQGNVLLFQVKNLMKPNQLGQLKGTRYFTDGTVITASSVFGRDQIIIDVSNSTAIGLKPSCSITLFNIPEVIPPMKWYSPGIETWEKVGDAWVIRNPDGVVEVEGVDYIKTYYSWNITDCPGCIPFELTVAVGDDANILTGSSPNRPFWYKSENANGSLIYNYEGAMVPHYMGYTTDLGVVIPENPLKHTIYSLWDVCQAQILENGDTWSFDDAGGSYFLWKAYTEWSNTGPEVVDFSRTGLGYMLMQGFIENKGINLCETDGTIIKVDCCLKPVEERDVILYWESIGPGLAGGTTCTDQPFMFYGSIKICEVPAVIGPLWAMLCTPRNTKTFYVIPEIKGGCLPFEWTLSAGGGWTLEPSKPFGETAGLEYECTLGSPDCNATVDITVTDRCGTTDTFHSQSCCENDPTSLTIGYTSLQMSCSGIQTLEALGGCGPYSWSASSGSIESSAGGISAIYTAPAENEDCTQNPTITLTDCCGDSAEIKLAVNCYGPALSLRYCEIKVCSTCAYIPGYGCRFRAVQGRWDYACDGTLTSGTFIEPSPVANYDCSLAVTLWGCGDYPNSACTNCSGGPEFTCCNSACETGCTPACVGVDVCGLNDRRTPGMKTNGCCPINPLTGLPYD